MESATYIARACQDGGTTRSGKPTTFRAASTQQAPMASATICPPSSQPSLPSSCVPASPAAKGVGTAPQIAPRITALPLASRVSGMYPLESCARVARYDHHQFRGRERTSSCTCQRSGFQYLPTQFSTTLPIAGNGLRPAGRPSSTRSGIKQARAMRPAQAGSTHTVQRPAVVPTNPRARAARSTSCWPGSLLHEPRRADGSQEQGADNQRTVAQPRCRYQANAPRHQPCANKPEQGACEETASPQALSWCVYAIQRVSQAPRRSRYRLALSLADSQTRPVRATASGGSRLPGPRKTSTA